MGKRVHRIRGRGGKLRVSDWGAGEVTIGSDALSWARATLTIKGVRRLRKLLQRIEAGYREPL